MSEQMPANVGEDILRIHRVLTRSLTVSIQFLQQAEQPDNLHHGFMLYLRALSALLHAHHLGEDEIGFPFWRTKSPFAPLNNLIRDHLRMMPLLEKIEIWLNSESGWEAPHLRRLQGILEELNAIWLWHIQLEESVMGPEKAAALLTPAENQQLARQLATHGQEHAQPDALVLPFILYNLPVEDRAVMAQIFPPLVTRQLVPVEWKPVWEPMKPFLLE
ncbi:MAG TPA: hemerythrin domain-containing protein [Anaerolineaceae bacterium]|nr:hemerythrin domain-containing protein [Anaerolineaceae bacterium]HQO96898.1 hemerythrin domain-containing protein [Anaerolineaceae bacterium]